MPARIDPKTDFNILADLTLGLKHKEIATKYNVSVSYVSKINTGKKKVTVYIPEGVSDIQRAEHFKSDIDRLEEYLDTLPVSLEQSGAETTLDSLIIKKLSEIKILMSARKELRR